ncbi:hypothetical protein FDY95_00235 [Hymenobacter jeollabukensis]|uniref:Uncharacterized protein n=1 Tax=Hymenobacter jeollabukensis TaxID=2025313 RepID=A0A5R8WWE2_9BACT|nr:hypothetical protein FDY95_00235 [Hymenobacter jeollabukensis]
MSVVSCQLSVVSCQLSVVSCQLSVVRVYFIPSEQIQKRSFLRQERPFFLDCVLTTANSQLTTT